MATYTSNYNLEMPDQSEYYNVDVFNSNAETIDTSMKAIQDRAEAAVPRTGLYKIYSTTGTATAYFVNEIEAYEGYMVCVKLHVDTSASPTLNGSPLLQEPGKAFKGKEGGVYTFRYSGGSFFVQGGSGADLSAANAAPEDVVSGKIFFSGLSDEPQTGTLVQSVKSATFTYSFANKKQSDTITGLGFTPVAFVFNFRGSGPFDFGTAAVAGWKVVNAISSGSGGMPTQIAGDAAVSQIWNKSTTGSTPTVELSIGNIAEGGFSYSFTTTYDPTTVKVYVTGITVYGV